VGEDDPLPPPINHYAATKREAERLVRAAHAEGLSSIILRPRAIFGPGDTTIFPRILRALETGRLPVIGDAHNRVDLTYIDNAVQAVERALAAPDAVCGQAYNITNGEPVLLWETLRWLCRELALPPPRGRVPRSLGMLLGGALELYHHALRPNEEPKLTRYSVQVLACTMTLDISRARRQLGYAPDVTVQQGLTRFVAWWKEQACHA
jgi:nucleoside-diphosphate-sugar epimerase